MSAGPDPGPRVPFDRSVPVLVLRRALGPFQHCVLAITRSLGRVGVPVYAVRAHRGEPATRSRYLRGVLDLPGSTSGEQWVERIMALPAAFDGAILLPIDDLAAVTVGDHQELLLERFAAPHQPAGIQRRLASKRELWRLCREFGLATPSSTFPRSEGELLEQADGYGFPLVVKRAELWHPPRDPTAPSVAIVGDRAGLLLAYRRMESDVAPQVMLQEYLPGGAESVWMFNGCFGRDGTCLCGFTGRKLRQSGGGTGPTSLGVLEANDAVAGAARRLLQALDYRGIVDMGFRYDRRDGAYKLIDVNPRVGSTLRLFTAANGIDVVRALHLDLTGRAVPACDHPDGRTWIDERADPLAAARLVRARSLGIGAWLRSLRDVDEAAWWAADDPWPFVLAAARLGPYAARRVARQRRAIEPSALP